MAKSIHFVVFLFMLCMVCVDAFHVGVGKVGRRKKRTIKLADDLQDTLQDLCLFKSRHCADEDSTGEEPQTLAVRLIKARKRQERNLHRTLRIVCKASTSVCKPAAQRSKRSAELIWPQEKKYRRPIYTVTST